MIDTRSVPTRGGRRAVSLVEIVVLLFLAAVLLAAALTLSSQNMESQAEMTERTLVQGVALDALERLKRYKVGWTLPGAPDTDGDGQPTPIDELYGPLEADSGRMTAVDRALATEMAALGMPATPKVERVEDPEYPGLFRLDVTVKWTPRRGGERQVRFSRYCYAP